MAISFKCPACGSKFNAPDAAAEKVVKCSCGAQVRVPKPRPVDVLNGIPSPADEPELEVKPDPEPETGSCRPHPCEMCGVAVLDNSRICRGCREAMGAVPGTQAPRKLPSPAAVPTAAGTGTSAGNKLLNTAVGVIIAVIGIGAALQSCKEWVKELGTTTRGAESESDSALGAARYFVDQRCEPRKVNTHGPPLSRVEPGSIPSRWSAVVAADGQNAFGVMIRSEFDVVVEREGANWKLISIHER